MTKCIQCCNCRKCFYSKNHHRYKNAQCGSNDPQKFSEQFASDICSGQGECSGCSYPDPNAPAGNTCGGGSREDTCGGTQAYGNQCETQERHNYQLQNQCGLTQFQPCGGDTVNMSYGNQQCQQGSGDACNPYFSQPGQNGDCSPCGCGDEFTGRTDDVERLRQRMRSSHDMKASLAWHADDDCLTCVQRKFAGRGSGEVGKGVVHYGAAEDCDIPKTLVHGVTWKKMDSIRPILNPKVKSTYEQKQLEIDERIYESNKRAPLGHPPDPYERLPAHVDPEETRFGMATKVQEADNTVGALMNIRCNCCDPCKPVTCPSLEVHPPVGTQTDRGYKKPFNKSNIFGISTPCDYTGQQTNNVVSKWRTGSETAYANKTYMDHLDQRVPKLGMTQDRYKMNRSVDPCHTFGTRSKKQLNEPRFSEVVFNLCRDENKDLFIQYMQQLKNWLQEFRRIKNKEHVPGLEDFYEIMKKSEGIEPVDHNKCNPLAVSWETFICGLKHCHLPCMDSGERFKEILAYFRFYQPCPCDKVNINGFMDLVRGYQDPKFPLYTRGFCVHYPDWSNGTGPNHYKTTIEHLANLIWCCGANRNDNNTQSSKCGKNKSSTNPKCGNADNAYSLIWPSYYTKLGLGLEDVYQARDGRTLRQFFSDAGTPVSYDDFSETWKKVKAANTEGLVSIQSLKNAFYGYGSQGGKCGDAPCGGYGVPGGATSYEDRDVEYKWPKREKKKDNGPIPNTYEGINAEASQSDGYLNPEIVQPGTRNYSRTRSLSESKVEVESRSDSTY